MEEPIQQKPVRTSAGTDDLLPTRHSLLGRLKDWADHRSWQEFFDTYWRLIYEVALKSGLSATEAEEVVQETLVSVAKAMRQFQYDRRRGSFKGWLLQLTGWRIANQFRKRPARHLAGAALPAPPPPETESSPAGAEFAVPAELERLWDLEWEQNLVRTALERLRPRVNPKHLQIFDLHVIKQKNVGDVRQFLGVSTAQVYLAKHRVGKLFRKEVGRLRSDLI
ncbi:MAG TPA: sigma-70 family RNA polymerase sigma factor [Verrucomicrobiae bacterium]